MNSSRKAAIQAYKERKPARGIFAIRSSVTSALWVDSAMDLPAAENRIWFALRLGDKQLDKSLAAEFNQHGRDAFTFEILETLADDITPMALRDLLKERKFHWMAELSAGKISPI
jgi:hypothetical protein